MAVITPTPATAATTTAQAGQIDLTKTPQWDAATATAAQTPGVATYDANTRTVGDNETVYGLLGKYLSKGSPLVQQAQTSVQQTANTRGLANSSMAAGAGYQAAVNTMTPIAQADANTYSTASRDNQVATNTALQSNTAATNEMAKFNTSNQQQVALANQNATNTAAQSDANILAQAQTQNAQNQQTTNTFNAQQNNAQAQFNASQSNDILKTTLDVNNKSELMNIEASYKSLLQANSSAGEIYQQMIKSIETIQTNKDLTAATKSILIQNQMTLANNGIGMIGAMSNIPGMQDILNFGPLPSDPGSTDTNKVVDNVSSKNVKAGYASSYPDGSTTSDNIWIVKDGKWIKNL